MSAAAGGRPVPQPRSGDRSGEETVAQLTAQLKQARTQRLDDEAEAAQLGVLLRAIVLSRRDRDAGSSPVLAEHREHLERMFGELENMVCVAARVAIRLQVRGTSGQDDDPTTRRALRAIEQSRAALAAFAEAVNQA